MMKQYTYNKRAAIHGLSMAVFLGACLGLQAADKKISAEASVNSDNARVETSADRDHSDSGKLSRSDAHFVREAAQGGLMEVHMGQMAKDNGSNADVKAYGETLVKDHTKANDKLAKLAGAKGVNLAKDVEPKHGSMMKDLEGKTGADFDRVFVEHAVTDHKKDIAKFEKASRDLTDTELRAFATETLPVLRGHLDEAQRIAKAMGIDVKVTDASEYGSNVNSSGNLSASANAGSPGLSVEAQNSAVNRVDIDRDHKASADVNINTDKSDGKTLGVTTQPGDNKTLGVETRASDNKVLGVQTGPGDGKTLGLNTRKDDGKILGIIPAPGAKHEAEVKVGDDHAARVDVDVDRDKNDGKTLGLNTSKTDGKILGTVDAPSANHDAEVKVGDHSAKVDVDVDRDKSDGKTLGVDAGTDQHKTLGVTTVPGDGKTLGLNTRKDDGKLLGIIPAPGHNKPENRVDVNVDKTDHKVEVNANTDRDAAIGAPASSEKGHKVEADVDVKNHDASVSASANTLSYKEVPSAVQDAIRKAGGTSDVKNIKKQTMNGKTAYKVEFKQDGRNRVLHVAEDGTIVKDNNK